MTDEDFPFLRLSFLTFIGTFDQISRTKLADLMLFEVAMVFDKMVILILDREYIIR